MPLNADWSNLSVGVGAILGLIYVSRVLRGMQKDTLMFFSNHMHNISSSLEAVAVNLGILNERVDRLHEDNVKMARDLQYADRTVTRRVEEQDMTALTERLNQIEGGEDGTREVLES